MADVSKLKNIGLFLAILVAPNVVPRTSILTNFIVRICLIALLAIFMLNSNIEIIGAIVGAMIVISILQRFENFELGPNTNILNGCHGKLVMKDILDKFDGDVDKAKEIIYMEAHCPMNVLLTDENAPLIATFLVNYNPCKFNFGDECSLPHEQH